MDKKQIIHSPLIRTTDTTQRIMLDVALALVPCWLAGIIFFGWQAVWVVLLSTITAVVVEGLLLRRPFTLQGYLSDGSALVTGMLVGLILSPSVPWWVPVLGSLFAIILGKLVFGGLGANIFNPALVGRAILLLGFTAPMVKFVTPFDAVSQATPLLTMRSFDWSLVWGNVGGSIGETSVIAILLGAAYLFYRKHIDWRIPVGYVGAAFITSWLWGIDPWMAITAGGLLFAAVFMATDMVTSPVTPMGRFVFGCGCGFLTIFIRKFTSFPEGVTFAVLTMNALVPLLDKITVPVKFGASITREQRVRTAVAAVVIACLAWGVLAIINLVTPEGTLSTVEGVYLPLKETLGTDAYQKVTLNDQTYYYTGDAENPDRVALVGSEQGFHNLIYFYMVLDTNGTIEHLQILSHNEDPGLGSLVTRAEFLDQFIGLNMEDDVALGMDIQGVTGATISSRAVIRGVRKELDRFKQAFYPDAVDVNVAYADGTYVGEAAGFGGTIKVEVVVNGGAITEVKVLKHQETPGISDPAIKQIPERIVTANSSDVDKVSGATYTSEGIMQAVKNALLSAAGSTEEKSENASGDGIAAGIPDGVYVGTGKGFMGKLEAEVTVAGGKITAVKVIKHVDTPEIANPAIEKLSAKVVEEQKLVDVVSGATYTSKGFLEAVEAALNSAPKAGGAEAGGIAAGIPDGVYVGTGKGFMGKLEAEVTVAGGKIIAVKVIKHVDTPEIANPAIEKLSAKVVEEQKLVDAVSGATYTSKGFLEAVEAALSGKEAK